jgi:hypothetical protein
MVGRAGVKIGPVSVILLLSHLLSITAKELGQATGTAGTTCFSTRSRLALMMRRARVKVGPVSVILLLSHLLSITTEELS